MMSVASNSDGNHVCAKRPGLCCRIQDVVMTTPMYTAESTASGKSADGTFDPSTSESSTMAPSARYRTHRCQSNTSQRRFACSVSSASPSSTDTIGSSWVTLIVDGGTTGTWGPAGTFGGSSLSTRIGEDIGRFEAAPKLHAKRWGRKIYVVAQSVTSEVPGVGRLGARHYRVEEGAVGKPPTAPNS